MSRALRSALEATQRDLRMFMQMVEERASARQTVEYMRRRDRAISEALAAPESDDIDVEPTS